MTRMTFRRSAEDLPLPLASADSSTTSLPLLLGTGGSLQWTAWQHGEVDTSHLQKLSGTTLRKHAMAS